MRPYARGGQPGRPRALLAALCLALLPAGGLASSHVLPAGGREVPAPYPLRTADRMQEVGDPSELFKRQCAACHGRTGEGDGPAARALNPRPPDLTDSERIGALSDAELLAVLTKGRGAMPSFGSLLKPPEISALVDYIRELSQTGNTR